MKVSVVAGLAFIVLAVICLLLPVGAGGRIAIGGLFLAGLLTPATTVWAARAQKGLDEALRRLAGGRG